MESKQHKVVAIGGGTGLSAILRGLKKKNLDITAIVTVADDGGSSGKLRDQLDMLPPGDIRNVLISLADTEPLLEKVLQYRFQQGEGLAGHNLGNLLLAALQDMTGDFVSAIKELSRVLAVKGKVLPATLQQVSLIAEFTDGTRIKGESRIPTTGKSIKQVYIVPHDVEPLDEAIEAIQKADAILIGPGSLYTSIIPNLLVKGIKDAILAAKGKKIFICNVMTQPGETDHYQAIDHVKAVEKHVGERFIDYVIVQNGKIPAKMIERYRQQGAEPVKANIEILESQGYKVVADQFLKYNTYLRHNADKLSDRIIMILEGKGNQSSEKN
ncbi:gluconeogenesis factor YvcK family protein [Tepidibacillus fermentans]|uniref:Gluconeogenesis factor n=1 Tax=Tepidibacillus fermentans TaxID=1281767 RepID=A0A4R3KET5_9BACI|nr:YvcK family protein [Tepidibacillus fermentans]TCS81777.1 putative cofD-like protein [Tepidibacillus fermentans]